MQGVEALHQVAEGGQVLRGRAGARGRLILAQGDIAGIVEDVFDRPVAADGVVELGGTQAVVGAAGNQGIGRRGWTLRDLRWCEVRMRSAAWAASGKAGLFRGGRKGEQLAQLMPTVGLVQSADRRKKIGPAGQTRQGAQELGLVGFDRHEVVGLLDLDHIGGAVVLGMDRIDGEQGPGQVLIGQEVFEGGDFVGLAGDADLFVDQMTLVREQAEELAGLAVDLGDGADALAVGGEGPFRARAFMRAEPLGQDGVEGLGSEALDGAAKGALAGSAVAAGGWRGRGRRGADAVGFGRGTRRTGRWPGRSCCRRASPRR